MIIDCDECVMTGTSACRDCVVTAILRDEPAPVELQSVEERALGHLAEAGLVAPLRLFPRKELRRRAGGET